MAEEKWYFTKEQLSDSPSRKCGIEPQQESKYRQQAADLIQNMGQSLMVSQLCINTAIVYMHRFYAFHSFTHFHRNHIAAASLFLAAKVEEQPRKLQSVIEAGHNCLYPKSGRIDINSEHFLEQTQDLIFNENILLQTLGFDVAIDHPHTHVVKTCHLVRAPKDLAQSSYFMASNSLHKTTMCLQYKPTVVACFCIHVACKWSNWQIPQSKEGKHWFEYVDTSVTTELLDRLTLEFLHYFDTNRSSDRARSDMNQERDSRKALAAQEEAHHRQHSTSSRNVHNSAHQGHSSQSVPHVNATQHRHGQHKISSSHTVQPQASYTQQHGNHHSATGQTHYNSQNPNLIQAAREQHKKVDDKMKHHPDYAKMQNINRPRVPPEANPNKNMHSRHKPDVHPAHNMFMDRSKDVNESYQNRMDVPEQRSSNILNRVDHYKTDKDLKPKVNPAPAMEMKKRDFNSMPKTNMNEYMSQTMQKPPPNYHEYKNQNNAASVSKHVLANENKHLQKPDMKPIVNPIPILEEQPKSEVMRTPPSKSSIFSPDNKDMSLYKKSKPDLKTPTSKRLSPSGRKMETPPPSKKLEGRIQERTPSQQIIKSDSKPKMNSAMRLTDTPVLPAVGNPIIPRPISPFISPLKKSNSSSRNRTRTSSSSDAELVPVLKKLEDLSEYGNFCKKNRDKVNVQNTNDKLQSNIINTVKPQPEILTANGIETNPDLISSLLKESLMGLDSTTSVNTNTMQMTIPPPVSNTLHMTIPTPVGNAVSIPNIPEVQSNTNDEYKHKSEKKKKKDKHKHKDKSKEERKKHKKDKERSKERQEVDLNAAPAIPIKITIPKDKIDMPEPSIKIKIPKERIKSLPRNESGVSEQRPVQGLKIKIPKEAMDNYSESSKKRERALSADRGPPPKSTRTT